MSFDSTKKLKLDQNDKFNKKYTRTLNHSKLESQKGRVRYDLMQKVNDSKKPLQPCKRKNQGHTSK